MSSARPSRPDFAFVPSAAKEYRPKPATPAGDFRKLKLSPNAAENKESRPGLKDLGSLVAARAEVEKNGQAERAEQSIPAGKTEQEARSAEKNEQATPKNQAEKPQNNPKRPVTPTKSEATNTFYLHSKPGQVVPKLERDPERTSDNAANESTSKATATLNTSRGQKSAHTRRKPRYNKPKHH